MPTRSILGLSMMVLPWHPIVTCFVLGPRKRHAVRGPSPTSTLPTPKDATLDPVQVGRLRCAGLRLSSMDVAGNLEANDNLPLYGQADTLRRDYHRLSVIYGVLAVILLLMPDRTLTKRLASKVGGASGFGLAAGVSNLLAKKKTSADQYDDDDAKTLQGLNVGLLGFSALGLLSVPGEAAFLPTPGLAMLLSGFMSVARLFGVMVAYRGGRKQSSIMGTMGTRKAISELLRGARATLQAIGVSKETKKRSLTYRNCLLLVLASMVSNLMEGLFCIRVSTIVVSKGGRAARRET
jgi:hypothetical protein